MKPSIKNLLEQAISDKVFPGCCLAVIEDGEITTGAFGHFTYDPTSALVSPETIYDCASLTKIVGPMAVAATLIDEGVLQLNEKVGTYLPEFLNQPEKELACLYHLMTYTLDYNIPGGSKSIIGTFSPEEIASNALALSLKATPGSNYVYSNITAFILTQIIERVTGKNFNDLVSERIFMPLKMETTTFTPDPDNYSIIPPTEDTDDRGLVQGFVHDEFTYHTTKGNVRNGAAGLFASATDMANFLQMTIAGGVYKEERIFSEQLVAMWTKDFLPELLPIHTPIMWGDQNNVLIDQYHPNIVVKSGFTGCFMAADLQNKRGFVLLSNRIYPKRPIDASAFGKVKEDLMEFVFKKTGL